jgi:hypothetical protein
VKGINDINAEYNMVNITNEKRKRKRKEENAGYGMRKTSLGY